jgi:hypothetical protein
MATLKQKIAAERAARSMLEDGGLPQPDEVEYGYTCIRLIWHQEKRVVIVQIDEPPPGHVFAEDLSDEEFERVIRDMEGTLGEDDWGNEGMEDVLGGEDRRN